MNKIDQTMHPLKTGAKVLLSSVFGPYARDDEYGSRKINPMELFHNQVTRVQGPFSYRMFHRSWGLMLLKENIDAPCTFLDFPTLNRFVNEIKNNDYDIIGISSIVHNVYKVKRMCEEMRKYLPNAIIVVGGHIANMPELGSIVDADFIVKGDGVRWFRKYLGQDENAPVKHPMFKAGFGSRVLGLPMLQEEKAAMLVPSVGCPMGCNFCCTSHMFGGKGKFVNFYETGDELFSVMAEIERKLKFHIFYILDENFLLHRKRALRLLELMKQHKKSWVLYVFSSVKVLSSYSVEQLLRMGIFQAWIGLEGKNSQYSKLNGVDTHKLVKELQSHGIVVLGSTIIGLENHTPENIDEVIDWAVEHETDFHQFMLYMPLPGTPFYEEHERKGTLLSENELSYADYHGQYRFNYRHEHIPAGKETKFLLKAFEREFEMNGPSIIRIIGTMLNGWKKYKNHPNQCVRKRFKRHKNILIFGSAVVWATRKWYEKNKRIFEKTNSLLQKLYSAFGWKTKIIAPLLGRIAYIAMKAEKRRLDADWTYEPPTFYEKNDKALKLCKIYCFPLTNKPFGAD